MQFQLRDVGSYASYRVLCHPLFLLSSLWQPLISVLSIVLSAPACHTVRTIWYIVFLHWVLCLSIIHLSFLHMFSGFDSYFLLFVFFFILFAAKIFFLFSFVLHNLAMICQHVVFFVLSFLKIPHIS
jgi:hypothetical protein